MEGVSSQSSRVTGGSSQLKMSIFKVGAVPLKK